MGDIRYVIVSDLHLGAGYSLLTNADEQGNPDPSVPSPALTGLAHGLRATVSALKGHTPPTLVLLGDVFDLSFAPARMAAMAFQRLVEAFFPPNGPDLFAPVILYVPGNHDHREWRVIRDAMFIDDVRTSTTDELPKRSAITDLFADRLPDSHLMTALMQKVSGRADLAVRAAYPNFAHRSDDRCVVMHHGHFNEGLYRAVSTLLDDLMEQAPTTDIEEIERVNGPWIDFFWSSFGDQGNEVADGVFNLYEAMLDAVGTHDLVEKVAHMMLERIGGLAPVSPSTKIGTDEFSVSAVGLVEAVLDLTVTHAAQNERMAHGTVLSPKAVAGLKWYLSGPVRQQLDSCAWPDGPATEFSYVFGHTHKPFQDELLVDGYDNPVQIWNTGGWVLDHPIMTPVQGASAVFVDDDAYVAALRLFNDPLNEGDLGTPRALGCGGPQDKTNPLLAELRAAVAATAAGWDPFSTGCRVGIHHRAAVLRRKTEKFIAGDHDKQVS